MYKFILCFKISTACQAWYNSVSFHAVRSAFDFMPAKVSISYLRGIFAYSGIALSNTFDDTKSTSRICHSINENFIHQVCVAVQMKKFLYPIQTQRSLYNRRMLGTHFECLYFMRTCSTDAAIQSKNSSV